MKDKNVLKTGFDSFDNAYGGLKKGHVILLGARPGMGTSALALSLIDNVCPRMKRRCIYISTDIHLQVPEITDRLLTVHMGAGGKEGNSEVKPISRKKAIDEVGKYNLVLMDNYFDMIDKKTEVFLKEVRRKPVSLIVIDGLQDWFTSSVNRLRKKGMLSFLKMVKTLATEQNCPVLIISDLKKSADSKPNHRPGVDDIRGIKDPFSEVDDILLLFREEYYDKDTPRKGKAELIVPSKTSDTVSRIDLEFSHEYARFY